MQKLKLNSVNNYKKCFVPNCVSNNFDNPDKEFLYVPEKSDVRIAWCNAVGIKPEKLQQKIHCCEDHFNLEEDLTNYWYYKTYGQRKRMKPGIVPHLNLQNISANMNNSSASYEKFNVSHSSESFDNSSGYHECCSECCDVSNYSDDIARNLKQLEFDGSFKCVDDNNVSHMACDSHTDSEQMEIDINSNVQFSSTKDSCDKCIYSCKKCSSEKLYANASVQTLSIEASTISLNPKTRMVADVSVQTESDIILSEAVNYSTNIKLCTSDKHGSEYDSVSTSHSRNSESASDLNTSLDSDATYSLESTHSTSSASTGINFELDLLKKTVYDNVTRVFIEQDTLLYLGVPQHSVFIIKQISDVTKIEIKKIHLTLQKIRLNEKNRELGHRFGYSERHVANIFQETVPVLSGLLEKLIFWPDKKNIQKNLPIAFRHRFKNVQSIIDAFEVPIEKPSNATLQSATWSEYKKRNTEKFIISITPSCIINFISKGYGGRTTDTYIIENDSYLAVLPRNCEVMADRGFKDLSYVLHQAKNCKLVCPCSVAADEKCAAADVKKSKQIASCRIHVERVIERIRDFRMLDFHNQVDKNYIYILSDIVKIVCALVNLQNRVLKQ